MNDFLPSPTNHAPTFCALSLFCLRFLVICWAYRVHSVHSRRGIHVSVSWKERQGFWEEEDRVDHRYEGGPSPAATGLHEHVLSLFFYAFTHHEIPQKMPRY